jgi:hypothetical protein
MMVSYAIVFSKWLPIAFSYTIIFELFLCVGHLAEGNYNCTSLGEEELLQQVDMEEDVQEEAADVRVDRQVVDVSDENNELLPSRKEQVEASSATRLWHPTPKLGWSVLTGSIRGANTEALTHNTHIHGPNTEILHEFLSYKRDT